MTVDSEGVAETVVIERIARVLASRPASTNADAASPASGHDVDQNWPDHVDTALAVLKAIREPDADMAAIGDTATWRRMIEAAIHGQRHIDLPVASGKDSGDVRNAGADHAGPWTRRDERLDESFPASDPAPVNPGVS